MHKLRGGYGDRPPPPKTGLGGFFLPDFIRRQIVGAAVLRRLCSPVSSAPYQSICEKCLDICVSFLTKMLS
jgi:hypothetical protein